MISFSLNSPYTPFNAFLNAVPTEVRISNLQRRVDTAWDELGFPQVWRPAERAMVLLALVDDPDWELLQKLNSRFLDVPEKPFEDASERFLLDMEHELARVESAMKQLRRPTDITRLWNDMQRELQGEKLLGGGCSNLPHRWIWGDAASAGLANAVGYLLGAVVQSAIENHFCDAKEHELGYGKRVLAELGNRGVQHLVRFLLRDLLFPGIKHRCGWHSLKMEEHMTRWQRVFSNLLVIVPLMAGDQIGVVLLTKVMPPVPLDEGRLTPDIWVNGAQMMVFAGTDFLAWTSANYLTQSCYGVPSKVDNKPREELCQKGVIHIAQVMMDGLILSAWKDAHDALNPNRHCLPGINKKNLPGRAPEYLLYALILDSVEITTMLAIQHGSELLRATSLPVPALCPVPLPYGMSASGPRPGMEEMALLSRPHPGMNEGLAMRSPQALGVEAEAGEAEL